MNDSSFDYASYARLHDSWLSYPACPLERDFSRQEYEHVWAVHAT